MLRRLRLKALLLVVAVMCGYSHTMLFAQRQLERLGRGLVALRTGTNSVFLSWRLLGTDPESTGFNVYRVTGTITNQLNSSLITNVTCLIDTSVNPSLTNRYIIKPVVDGAEVEPVGLVTLLPNTPIRNYIPVPLDIPPGGVTPDGVAYTYSANDASVGDLDGDGEYEIVLKWDPSNSKDNSQSGYTGPVIIDAYKLNGQRLWRINLGINIRAGAHYTQFMVYDLDGDGCAEMVCKTAPGTVDGMGNFVLMPGDNPYADYRNSSGYILSGPEYLTVFDGRTGAALWTTNYIPPRGNVSSWGDSYGNRVDRFLACVAYLDGVRPSVVMCRGYYTRTVLAAWDWRNGRLQLRWVFDTLNGYKNYEGQGNHNLSVADVDGDGMDEIVYGACAIDHDGRGLYSTGLGHGDAMHLSDMDPSLRGLEVWDVHETPSQYGAGEFRHAGTGYIYWGIPSSGDTGRGCAAPLLNSYIGYLCWSSASGGLFDTRGNYVGSKPSSCNFLVYWDGDLARELLDGITISKYNVGNLFTATGCSANNGTKSTPCLSGDILGDWREEVIWRTTDSSELRIYVSTNMATNRIYTLMHDPQYRLSIAWQNVAYNQPPHPGFYLGPGMDLPPIPQISTATLVWRGNNTNNVWDLESTPNWRTNFYWLSNYWFGADPPATVFFNGATVLFDMTGTNTLPVVISGLLQPSNVVVHSPGNYTFVGSGSLIGPMSLWKAGQGSLALNNTNYYTGITHVRDGTLAVDGLLSSSRLIARGRGVWGPATVAGFGTLGNGATVLNSAAIAPGRNGLAGTLTIYNGFFITNGTLLIDLSSDPSGTILSNDLLFVNGSVYAGGSNTISVRKLNGSLGIGQYTLLRCNTGILGNAMTWNLLGLENVPYQLIIQNTGLYLKVFDFTYTNRSIVWRGDGKSNFWDVGISTNWVDSTSQFTCFITGNTVEFNDSGSNNVPVNIIHYVSPTRVKINSTKTYQFTGPGAIAGSTCVLEKSGSGSVIVSNCNSYGGGTILLSGTFQPGTIAANMGAFGTGPITFAGGTLRFHGFGGSTGTDWGGHTNTWIVPAGSTGTVLMPPRFGYGSPFKSTLVGSGELRIVTDYVRCSFAGDWSQFNGVIKVGPRSGSAEFRLNNAQGLPNARLYLSNGITAYNIWGDNAVIEIGALEGEARAVLGPGNGSSSNPTWRVGWRNDNAEFKGSIKDAGITSLIKVGTGIWRLSGTNSYTGTTLVQGGSLVINGSNAEATNIVTVLSGATIGGRGIIGGPLLIGGKLSPGDQGVGTLTCLSDIILSNTAVAIFELVSPNQCDVLTTKGTLRCGGTLFVTNLGPSLVAGSYKILDAAQIQGQFTTVLLPQLPAGLEWDVRSLYTTGTLVVYARPKLKTYVLGKSIIIAGEELPAGLQCVLLSTTNLYMPLSSWQRLATNYVGSSGSIAFTNSIQNDLTRFFAIWITQ